MFRRRRRQTTEVVAPAPAPEFTGEQVFDLLNSRLADLIGAHGEWTLVRRTDDDTDQIFHAMLTHQIAAELTHAVLAEQSALRVAAGAEPVALSWTPAPLVVWAEPEPRALEGAVDEAANAA